MEEQAEKKLKEDMRLVFKDLEFTNSADDFVTYDEVQRAALNLNMTMPTKEQIDYHMKFFFKMLPTRQQRREGFAGIIMDGPGVQAAFEKREELVEEALIKQHRENLPAKTEKTIVDEPPCKKPKQTVGLHIPPVLAANVKKWSIVNKGQPDGLTERLKQDVKDKAEMDNLKKEILIQTARTEVSEFDLEQTKNLNLLQSNYIDILERRCLNLDNILQRNLM